jgi:RNA polymerase sigma factor (sigma-70 family)
VRPESITNEEICRIALKMAMQRLSSKRLAGRAHLVEDAAQWIALAGIKRWEETKDIGKMKGRMRDRWKDWWRDYCRNELPQPVSESSMPQAVNEDGQRVGFLEMRPDQHLGPFEQAAFKDFLAHLTERQQRIFQLAYAGNKNKQIAEELAVSVRTVERERSIIEKEYVREFSK